jgi:hypothetical protein
MLRCDENPLGVDRAIIYTRKEHTGGDFLPHVYRALVAFCAILGCIAFARAQTPADAMQHDIGAACHADYAAHCSGVAPGSAAANSCLQQNLAALSAPCQSALAQLPTDAQRSAIRSACQSDYLTYCKTTTPGGVAALSCLQQNLSALSASCRSAVGAVGHGPAAAPASSLQRWPAMSIALRQHDFCMNLQPRG